MITETFNNSKAIISPEDLNGGRKDLPKVMIGFFESHFAKKIEEKYSPEKPFKLYTGHKIATGTIEYMDKEIGYFQSDIGGPATVSVLENIFSRGTEKVLFFGSCGCLDNSIPKGHIIVPEAAYRDEGTSYHYAPPSDYIAVPTAERLSEILDEISVPAIRTRTWTTDAIFRETIDSMTKRKEEGCSTVEMECASIMACAAYRNKEVYQFLYTADYLEGTYDTALLSKPESLTERILEIALEVAVRL